MLTPATLDLFLSLAKDAGNWSGYPLISVTPQQKGNLTHLKTAGLIRTFVDEDCSFAEFTEAGKALAADHGVDLSWVEVF